MLNRIFSTFKFSINSCFKTNFVISLSIICFLIVLFLPNIIGFSGKEAGVATKIVLSWTPFITLFVIIFSVVWLGCFSYSEDIAEKRYISTAVSPVSPFESFVGRFLGYSTVLFFVMFFIFLMIYFKASSVSGMSTPKDKIQLSYESCDAYVDKIVSSMKEKNLLENIHDYSSIKENLRDMMKRQYIPINPGNKISWIYELDNIDYSNLKGNVDVKFQFLSHNGALGSGNCVCRVLSSNGDLLGELSVDDSHHGLASFSFPVSNLTNNKKLYVEVENTESLDEGSSLMFGYFESMNLYIPRGCLFSNILKAFLISFSLIIALLSLSMVCGIIFSLPVSVFVSIAIIAMVMIGNTELESVYNITHDHEASSKIFVIIESFSINLSLFIKKISSTFFEINPIGKLGDQLYISEKSVGKAIMQYILILPSIFCFIASVALRKKEFK